MSIVDFILSNTLISGMMALGGAVLGLAGLIALGLVGRSLLQTLARQRQARRVTPPFVMLDDLDELGDEDEPPAFDALAHLEAKVARRRGKTQKHTPSREPRRASAPQADEDTPPPAARPAAPAAAVASAAPAASPFAAPPVALPSAPAAETVTAATSESSSEALPSSDLADILTSVFLDEDAMHRHEVLMRDAPRASAAEIATFAKEILARLSA